jgi:hypothetical protein
MISTNTQKGESQVVNISCGEIVCSTNLDDHLGEATRWWQITKPTQTHTPKIAKSESTGNKSRPKRKGAWFPFDVSGMASITAQNNNKKQPTKLSSKDKFSQQHSCLPRIASVLLVTVV